VSKWLVILAFKKWVVWFWAAQTAVLKMRGENLEANPLPAQMCLRVGEDEII
jgi:hypothetical protein